MGVSLRCPLWLCRTCPPHTGAAPRLWATQPLCLAGPLPAWRLRYARARMGRQRRRRPRLRQLSPDKLGTSGSAGTSPSPSGCASSPEPRRSTWPWASAGSSWSAPWSRGLCSPVGWRASTWVRGRQGMGWQRQEASRHGRTGTWGSGRRTGFRTRNQGSPELTINGLFNSGPVPTSDPVSVLQSLRMTQDMLRMGTDPTSFHPFHCNNPGSSHRHLCPRLVPAPATWCLSLLPLTPGSILHPAEQAF